MTEIEMKEKLTGLIAEMLEVEESHVLESADFRKDLGADSLDLMELIMEIENEFEHEISDADAQQITTVGQAFAYIQAKM